MKLKKKKTCRAKEAVNQEAVQRMGEKSLSAIHVTEDLYLQYVRKLKSLNIKKTNNPVRKRAMDLNREPLKGEIRRTKGHCER